MGAPFGSIVAASIAFVLAALLPASGGTGGGSFGRVPSASDSEARMSAAQAVGCIGTPSLTFERLLHGSGYVFSLDVPGDAFAYCSFQTLRSASDYVNGTPKSPNEGEVRMINTSNEVWKLKPEAPGKLVASDRRAKYSTYRHRFPSKQGETTLAPGESAIFSAATTRFSIAVSDSSTARWLTYKEILLNAASKGADAASEAVREHSPTSSAILKCVATGAKDYKLFHPETASGESESAEDIYDAAVSSKDCLTAWARLASKNRASHIGVKISPLVKSGSVIETDEAEILIESVVAALVKDCLEDCHR